jgi:hypothetical protein
MAITRYKIKLRIQTDEYTYFAVSRDVCYAIDKLYNQQSAEHPCECECTFGRCSEYIVCYHGRVYSAKQALERDIITAKAMGLLRTRSKKAK